MMLDVQAKRQRLDGFLLRLTERQSEAKRRLDYLAEHLRQSKVVISQDESIIRIKSRSDRAATVDAYLFTIAANLTAAKAYHDDLRMAREAVSAAVKTCETAKETLNAIRSLIVAELSNQPGSATYHPRPPFKV
jgi:predicted transcriptional regulator